MLLRISCPQGVVLPSSRKLSHYRAGLRRDQYSAGKGCCERTQTQRAYDNLLAALNGTQSLTFRQRLLGSDDTKMDLYTIAQDAGRDCKKAPRHSRRFLEQQRRRTRSANRNATNPAMQQQLGFRFCLSSMSNALRRQRSSWTDLASVRLGQFRSTNARHPEWPGRQVRGSNQAESSSAADFFFVEFSSYVMTQPSFSQPFSAPLQCLGR